MGLGERLAYHPDIQGGGAPLAHLGRVGQYLAALGQLVEGRCPDIGTIDVTPLPGGDDGRRLKVDDLQAGRIHTPVPQRGQQAVVGGGGKGHGDALAGQGRRGSEPGLDHQRFRVAELGGEQKHLDGHLLVDGHRQRAGADVADLHVAGGERPHHAGAAVELEPLHRGAAGAGKGVVGLSHLGRFGRGLVGHSNVHGPGLQAEQGERRQPEGMSFSCHDIAPSGE